MLYIKSLLSTWLVVLAFCLCSYALTAVVVKAGYGDVRFVRMLANIASLAGAFLAIKVLHDWEPTSQVPFVGFGVAFIGMIFLMSLANQYLTDYFAMRDQPVLRGSNQQLLTKEEPFVVIIEDAAIDRSYKGKISTTNTSSAGQSGKHAEVYGIAGTGSDDIRNMRFFLDVSDFKELDKAGFKKGKLHGFRYLASDTAYSAASQLEGKGFSLSKNLVFLKPVQNADTAATDALNEVLWFLHWLLGIITVVSLGSVAMLSAKE